MVFGQDQGEVDGNPVVVPGEHENDKLAVEVVAAVLAGFSLLTGRPLLASFVLGAGIDDEIDQTISRRRQCRQGLIYCPAEEPFGHSCIEP